MTIRRVGRVALVLGAVGMAACTGNRPSEGALPEELDTIQAPVVLPAGIQGTYAATVPLPTGRARTVRLQLAADNAAVWRTADAGAAPVERAGRYRGADGGAYLEVDLPTLMDTGRRRDTLVFRISPGALTHVPSMAPDYVGDLVLRKEGGMTVGDPPGLPGTSWTLLQLEGAPVTGDLTLEFAAGGEPRASGNAGCNRFSGGYTQAGTSLRFGPLISTKRACAEDAMNRQESAYLGALQNVTRAVVTTDRMDLFAGDRLVARLARS